MKIAATVQHNHSEELTLRLAELEKEAYEMAGEEFNLSSPSSCRLFSLKNRVFTREKTPGGAIT
ncbi:hypothetical protein ACLK1S_24040 [Escherichia coli]